MAALSPFAYSVLRVEQAMDRAQPFSSGQAPAHNVARAHRSRRITSHYNTFQTSCTPDLDGPPSYAIASRQRPDCQESPCEVLPNYECTVSMEAKVLVNLESISPLHCVSQSEWREVIVDIRGTMLSVYRACKDSTKGKLLRSYTLQHAEVGLATDACHTVYTPQTRLAHFIPSPARAKAHKKDPRLFSVEKQVIMRIRIETDQILIAHYSREVIDQLVHTFAAGIDIAQPIDDRSATRQCTIPRRRRRDRVAVQADISDPTLIAEQERILCAMYPSLSANTGDTGHEEQRTPMVEEDEIDMSAIRAVDEETVSPRPQLARTISSSSQDLLQTASDPTNFTSDGKWRPGHNRTALQAARYAARCMPVLLAEAPRASDILIYNGHRVRINHRLETLDDWELKPPSYRSHHFKKMKPLMLERSSSSASTIRDTHGSDVPTESDEITPLDSPMSNLELAKIVSPVGSIDKALTQPRPRDALRKAHSTDSSTIAAFGGAVYCF